VWYQPQPVTDGTDWRDWSNYSRQMNEQSLLTHLLHRSHARVTRIRAAFLFRRLDSNSWLLELRDSGTVAMFVVRTQSYPHRFRTKWRKFRVVVQDSVPATQ
jgi:hypothetical protein